MLNVSVLKNLAGALALTAALVGAFALLKHPENFSKGSKQDTQSQKICISQIQKACDIFMDQRVKLEVHQRNNFRLTLKDTEDYSNKVFELQIDLISKDGISRRTQSTLVTVNDLSSPSTFIEIMSTKSELIKEGSLLWSQ